MGDWRDVAACRPMPSRWFFPEPGLGRDAAAKEVCAGCEVRDACLQFALTTNEPFGIYGGMTPGERQRLQDGARLRDLHCSHCARPFKVWWERGKLPTFCSESCRRDSRLESQRKYHAKVG